MYLSKLGMISVEEATKNLTSSLKGFKLEAHEAMSVVDKLTAIDVKAATSAGEIATGLSMFANLASLNGINIDQASAMVATIADVTQQSGSSVGQALKTIISRYGNVKSGAFSQLDTDYDSEGTTNNLNDVEKVLAKVGIAVRDSNLQFRELDDVLEDLSEKWVTLDNVSQNAIASAFAGTRQRESFLTLMQNMDKYHELLEESQNSAGTAQKKYDAYQESIEAWTKKLQAAWEELANDANINQFIKLILRVTTWLTKSLPTILKYATRFLAMSNAFKVGPMLKTFGGFLAPNVGKEGQGVGATLGEIFGSNKGYQRRAARYLNEQNGGGIVTQFKAAVDKFAASVNKDTQNTQTDQQTAQQNQQTAETETHNAETNTEAANTNLESANQNRINAQNNGGGAGAAGVNMLGKGQKVMARGAAAIMGGISGFATATTNSHDLISGQDYEMSKETAMFSRITTGAAQAIGSIWGPLVGMLAGGIMDALNKWVIGPLLDREKNAARDITQAGEKLLTASSEIAEAITSMGELVEKSIWTSEDRSQYDKYIDQIIDRVYARSSDKNEQAENDRYRILFTRILNETLGTGENKSFYELYEGVGNTTEAMQSFAQAIAVANKKVEIFGFELSQTENQKEYEKNYEESIKKLENRVIRASRLEDISREAASLGYRIDTNIKNDTNIVKQLESYAGSELDPQKREKAKKLADQAKYIESQMFAGEYDTLLSNVMKANKIADRSVDEYERYLKNWAEFNIADERDKQDFLDSIEEYSASVMEATAALNAFNRQVDEKKIEEAFLAATIEGQNIGSLNTSQLKAMGIDKIMASVADYLQGRGFSGNIYVNGKNGTLTDYAYNEIMKMARQDNNLSNLFSGSIYTLNEALKLPTDENGTIDYRINRGIIENFMAALGVSSVEELSEYADKFGAFTLGDLTLGLEDLEKKMSGVSSLLNDIVSGTKAWSEIQQTITQSYPELISYMSDSAKMQEVLIKNALALSEREIDTQFNNIMSNQEYFSKVQANIEEALNADELKEFQDQITKNEIKDLNGLAKIYNNLGETAKETFNSMMQDIQLISDKTQKELQKMVVKYQTSRLDREISNLEAQKQALSEINNQREYELRLVEARLKLENASKEKKRIWREGIGWTYEADQTAVAAAEQELSKVENEQKVSELEEQIEILKGTKQQFDDLEKIDEWNQLVEFMNEWTEAYNEGQTDTKNISDSADSILNALQRGDNSLISIVEDFSQKFSDYMDLEEKEKAKYLGNGESTGLLEQSWTKLEEKRKAYEEASNNGSLTNTHINDYNTALNEYKKNYETAAEKGYISKDQYGIEGGPDYLSEAALFTGMGSAGGYKEEKTLKEEEYFLLDGGTASADAQKKGIKKDQMYIIRKGALTSLDTLMGNKKGPYKNHKMSAWDLNGNSKAQQGTDPNTFLQNEGDGIYYFWGAYGRRFYIVEGGQIFEAGINQLDKNDAYGYGRHSTFDENFPIHWLPKSEGGTKDYKDQLATGTLSTAGGPVLLNELGTEAIITPQGTLTALPSKTGVVPADITANLWQLGELAPSIMRTLDSFESMGKINHGTAMTDESFNITNFTMNVTADDTFDAEEFVRSIRTQVALTRNKK